jgi:nitric oxide reductase subunit B
MKGLKIGAILSFIVSISVLLAGGYFSLDKVPPYPDRVSAGGKVFCDGATIKQGQDVYQKYGLMDHGSVWGHGTLRGPDFSATTLNLIGRHMREFYAKEKKSDYKSLSPDERSAIDARVIREIKNNTYDAGTGTLGLNPAQEYAFNQVVDYWKSVFKDGDKSNGFLPETIRDDKERTEIGAFFFWTAWAASTTRPGTNSTYTNNWPHDASVGNVLPDDAFLWSIFSILSLFLVLGIIIYVIHRYQFFYGEAKGVLVGQKLIDLPLTGSQVKAAKFFLVVILLFILQLMMGGLLAHYTVHPGTFYLDIVGALVPYSWAKSWHLQLAIFWVATSWVGTAIYLAPVIGGREPKGQGVLVNILFVAVVFVAVGSLAGEVLGIKGKLGDNWFWFGHQGWEYLELGRIWQILLFGGLIAWLVIVYRALKNRLYGPGKDDSGLVLFYTLSAILVVAFFGFGLFYGRGTHLSIADYWRWFVVHIWVEGIFEFFGVAIISLFLVTLGLAEKKSAMRVAYLTAILVFASGIIGTAHHYFWYGGPTYWIALGSVFSSLEPIPLITLVVRAWMEYKGIRDAGITFPYRWPLFFLVASSFWNFLGAGVFGFMINLPAVNYYEHATYLTSNHGHTALFGVYGMLSISLLLFTWRSLVKSEYWNEKILRLSFWGLNIGLFLMFSTTLLPIGISQVMAGYRQGFWYARSADFYNTRLIQILGQWRIVPDTIIIVFGALPLLYFLVTTYFRLKPGNIKGDQRIYQDKDSVI